MFFYILNWLIAIALALTGTFTFWPIQEWYDFYRPLVLLIGGFILGFALIILFFVLAGTFAVDMKKTYEKPSKFCRFCLNNGLAYIRRLSLVFCTVIHKDKFPKNKKVVLVCNHRSKFDNFLLTEKFFLNQDIAFIMKLSNGNIPIAKPFLHQLGYLAVDREDPLQSLTMMKTASDKIMNDVCSIGVFPEGTRAKDGVTLGNFHEGVFNIAIRAKCPIVICSIKGTEKIKKRAPLPTRVIIEVIGVMDYDEYQGMPAKQISETVNGILKENLCQ